MKADLLIDLGVGFLLLLGTGDWDLSSISGVIQEEPTIKGPY